MYHHDQLLVSNDLKVQLKELASNDMFKTLSQFKQNRCSLSLNPCMTASKKEAFLMLIKTHLRYSLNDKNLYNLYN